MNSNVCKICGNSKNNQEFHVKEMMFGFGDIFRYFQCSSCECLQIEDFPENIARYYPTNYYSLSPISAIPDGCRGFFRRFLQTKRNESSLLTGNFIGKVLCKKFPLDKDGVQHSLPIEFSELKRMGISFKSRILDVGCGSGGLLCDLQALGFKELTGVDQFISGNIEYTNGVRISKSTIHDIDESFDFIMFHHSFEHIRDPLETLLCVSRILSKGGVCLIRIPIVSSYAWKKYGVNWVQLDAPRHFFLHSIRSIELLSVEARLKIENTIYDSTSFQFWGSEQYLKSIPLMSELSYKRSSKNSIFSDDEIKLFEIEARKLNHCERGDQAAFYISKVN